MARHPKGVFEVGVSEELWEMIGSLDEDHKLWRWIDEMKGELLFNRLCGQSVEKKRIPDYYRDRYGVNNLYRYPHPEGYRSCYTLICDEAGNICAYILDLLSHREYEDRFGYRR